MPSVKNGISSYPTAVEIVLLFLVIIPISIAQVQTSSPETGPHLNRYDLFLLTTQQLPSATQSILLLDITRAEQNKLISLPSINNLFQSNDDNNRTQSSSKPAITNKLSAYEYVTLDVARDLIYFSCDKGIGRMEVVEEGDKMSGRRYEVVYRVLEGSTITNIQYLNDTLYWIEDQKSIKSLSTMNDLKSNPSDLIRSSDDEKIQGLAISSSTSHGSRLYYSTWPTYSRTNASIQSLDLNTLEHEIIATGLFLPRSVGSGGDALYWISNPPGIYFTIEKIGLNNESKSSVIMRQAHQHGGSLAVICGKVYWTDVVDKRVWVLEEGMSRSVVVSEKMLGGSPNAGFIGVGVVAAGRRDCSGEGVRRNDGVEVLGAFAKGIKEQEGLLKKQDLKRMMTDDKDNSSRNNNVSVTRPSSSTIRLCTAGEAGLINCAGGDNVCVILGFSSVPLCLSRRPSTPTTAKNTSLASASKLQQTEITTQHQPSSQSSWTPEIIAIISILATLSVIMTLLTLFFVLRVRSLSKKPTIRRRIVVSRRSSENAGDFGSGGGQPTSVCEMIDIENCCNMNVCETPCYERALLQPTPTNSSSSPSPNNNNNSTTTTTTTTVISVNSSNTGWGSSSCGGGNGKETKDDKRCLLSI